MLLKYYFMIPILIILAICIILYFYHHKGIPVFLFHHIQNDFEDYLKIIEKSGFKTYTFSEVWSIISANNKIPLKTLLITIDDGYIDNYIVGFPLLKKYKLKATIFINTAYIGTDDRYMNWTQIDEMYKSKLIDFELHSHNHFAIFINNKSIRSASENDLLNPELQRLYKGNLNYGDPVFITGSSYSNKGFIVTDNYIETRDPELLLCETEEQALERIRNDISENKKIIKEKLLKDTMFFAWPWGENSDFGKKAIRMAGVKGFVTSRKGTNSRRLNLDKIYRIEHRNLSQVKFKITLFVCQNLILGKIYKLLS